MSDEDKKVGGYDSDGIDDTPLEPEEIAEAQQRIEELHPLYDLPLHRVFPLWALCIKKCAKKPKAKRVSPAEKHKDEMERLNKAGQDLNVSGVSVSEPLLGGADANPFPEGEDPYLMLGFGMVAYFSMLKALILMFSLFTLLVLPVISIYGSYDGLSSGNNYSKTKYSLGNMGFSEHICKHIFTQIDGKYEFACRTGTIENLEFQGILPYNEDPKEFEKYMGYCNDPTKFPAVNSCTPALKTEEIKKYINTQCKDQTSCQGSIEVADMLNDKASGVAPEVCWHHKSIIYLQYSCTQPLQGVDNAGDKNLNVKREQGLFVACIGILISLLYLTCCYYLSTVASIEFKQWDVGTVTASDFTVEYQIPKVVWQKFEDQHTDKTRAEGTDFEEYLKKEFERIVSEQPSVLYPDQENNGVKIANITFAFKNAKLIKLLRKRGSAVAAGMFKNLPAIDEEINDLKEKDLQLLTKPVSAFITFETQDGFERACEFKGTVKCNGEVEAEKEFDGAPLYFEDAPEPTNIIWEHRQNGYATIMNRTFIVSAIIVFLLLLAFLAFFYLKQATVANYRKYPPTTNCQDIFNIFKIKGEANDPSIKPEELVEITSDTPEAKSFLSNADNDKELIVNYGTGTGIYQCYCGALQKEIGQVAIFDNPVCKMFVEDFFGGKALSQVVSISIVVINLVLRSIMLVLIKWIGYHTESGQTAAIMTSIFVVQFFNTAILLILTNANTEDAGLGFLPFKGMYNDLNFEWYNDIGSSFITTMGTAAVFPVIEFCIAYGMKFAFKFLDRGCKLQGETTKKNTIQAYINLYAGPEYAMHFKYSGMMNVLFVCFMYGLAIPMLFPISLLAFTVLYTTEKLTITYFYRQPPMFDEKLNEGAISKMKWAPIFMMFFGYWCLSNVQLFTNKSGAIVSTLQPVESYHRMWTFGINQALPLLVVGLFLGITIFFNDLALSILNRFGIMMPKDEDEVDEGLGTYWECLDKHDRRVWFLDETHMQKNLGLTTLDPEAYRILKEDKPGKKTMATTPNYEIVSNPRYAEAFQYCPIDFRDTEEEKETSDMVLKILNLAYTPESEAANFKFQGSRSKKRSTHKGLETAIQ